MDDFTEADVEAGSRAMHGAEGCDCRGRFYSDEVPVRAILAAVAPAMRDRWLGELADKARNSVEPEAAAWILTQVACKHQHVRHQATCLDCGEPRLRSGGDSDGATRHARR
jgi:hypothetical protein